LTRRSIRLKELEPGSSGTHIPSDDYIKRTDGSLPQIPYSFSVTRDGFLDTEIPDRPHAPSMYLLGDSFVESMFAQPKDRFASRIGESLNVNIRNGGYSGATSLHLLNVFINKIVPSCMPGDTVVFFVPKSDINASLSGYWAPERTLTPILPSSNTVRDATLQDTYSFLVLLVNASRLFSISLVLAISPDRYADFSTEQWIRNTFRRNRTLFNQAREASDAIDTISRDVASEMSVPIIDLQSEFGRKEQLFYDRLHLNSVGQPVIAEFLSNHLENYQGLGL
jgi:lysophospholipase L1-like esterase